MPPTRLRPFEEKNIDTGEKPGPINPGKTMRQVEDLMKLWRLTVLALLFALCLLACSSRDETKDYDRIIAECSQAIERNPKDAEAYLRRGSVYGRKGDLDHALPDLNRALDLNPKFAQAYYIRGLVYYNKGDLDRAIADFNRALRSTPNI